MLTHLRIHNFAVISELELDLNAGYTVLTGETGAGKSILVDALGLLLGNSGSDDLVRNGQEFALIEGHFRLSQLNGEIAEWVESDGRMVVLRKIVKGRPSVTRINGQTVPLKTLKTIMKGVIGITGQHEQMGLFETGVQLRIIDSFLDPDCEHLRLDVSKQFADWKASDTRLQSIETSERNVDQKIEFLKFQIADIESFGFQDGEEEMLNQAKKQLIHADILKESTAAALTSTDLIRAELYRLGVAVKKIASTHPEFGDVSVAISEMDVVVADWDQRLSSVRSNINSGHSYDIDSLEARLDLIFRAKNRYKVNSLDALFGILNHAKQELSVLLDRDKLMAECLAETSRLRVVLQDSAYRLHCARETKALELSQKVSERLADLGFYGAILDIAVRYDADTLNSNGGTSVEFKIAPNPGDGLKSLDRIASGGELSRIMLAFNSVFFEKKPTPTLVFDEVDTGVGGLTALKIGELLKLTSASIQVLVVTHLPQIAAMADHHLLLEKQVIDGRTHTLVRSLEPSVRATELKRMVGGEDVLQHIHQANTDMR